MRIGFDLRMALAIVCAMAFILPLAVSAQSPGYPLKPITIVVPLAPGGGSETETRLYAQQVTASEGYPFVVEHRPGAGTTLGTAYVAKASPDGHTLLMVLANFTIAPAAYPVTYDPVKDFAPIVLLSKRPLMLLIHPSLPVNSLPEYIAYARANPGVLNFATGGAGGSTHLAGAWLHHATKTVVTFIHYKSASAYTADVTAGRVNVATATPINAMAYIKSGKLHALGITTNTLMQLLPDLPTVAEQGVPGYDYSSWMGLSAPSGTPRTVVNKLNEVFIKALKTPGIADKLQNDGILLVGSTPEQFREHISVEVARWPVFIKETGMKLVE